MKSRIELTNGVFKKLFKEIAMNIDEMEQGLHKPLSGNEVNEFMPDSNCYVLVDKESNIYLPCFERTKILTLSPLPKALFFFFLLHPEGIFIFRLKEYRDELLRLYTHTSLNRKGNLNNEHIIDNLLIISNKRFYESLSQIKKALTNAFDEKETGMFCVIKNENGCYRISADRSKICLLIE